MAAPWPRVSLVRRLRGAGRRLSLSTVLLAVLLPLAGCEFDHTTVAPGDDRLVVHAVLNPTVLDQQILVERTLTGRVHIEDDGAIDPSDPIRSGGGVPVTGAEVRLIAPNGRSALARQRVTAGSGAPLQTGVYIIHNDRSSANDALEIVPGRTYRLEVREGTVSVVTGTATVPLPTEPFEIEPPLRFNRDTDTLRLRWTATTGAKQYAFRLETPIAPFFIFTDSTSLDIAGSLRNFLTDDLVRAFIPGFDQEVVVGAVDANYFDYYRSGSDPFTGSGLINHLEGGIGLFGAYVPLLRRNLQVTATLTDPVEGHYVGTAPGSSLELWLYVHARSGTVRALSGNVTGQSGRFGVLGTLIGTDLSLAVLRSMNRADTLSFYRGTAAGDSVAIVVQATRVVLHKVP